MFSGSDNLPVNIAASSQTYKKFKETLHEHLNAANLWKIWEQYLACERLQETWNIKDASQNIA